MQGIASREGERERERVTTKGAETVTKVARHIEEVKIEAAKKKTTFFFLKGETERLVYVCL